MRLLLDSHVLLWAHGAPDRLRAARPLLDDTANDLLFSAASAWELAIKVGLGRLTLPEPVDTWVPRRVAALGAQAVPVDVDHATRVAALPPVHRDPFDRILVAQCAAVGATLVSADPVFDRYPVQLFRF